MIPPEHGSVALLGVSKALSPSPLCLGVETSCDETALALYRDGRVLAEVMATQADAHALFGGVVPEIASREHYRVLGPLFDALLAQASVHAEEIEVVAAARGPGLLGGLLVGLCFAKGLALGCGARLIGVDHLHAHLLAAGLEQPLTFPALGLLVSGGHTHLYRLDGPVSLRLLGRTLDDAAGEAFDKVARLLRLPYPGGRHIDELAARGRVNKELFPRPYLDNQNLDFSFSGLKTALASYIAAHPGLALALDAEEALDAQAAERRLCEAPAELADLCASFNHCVADTLRIKTERALAREEGVRALLVAGGVAANSMIRETMAGVAKRKGLVLHLPSPARCTDNGAMIAYAGSVLAAEGYCHGLEVDAVPRGRKVPWDYRRATAC